MSKDKKKKPDDKRRALTPKSDTPDYHLLSGVKTNLYF